MKASAVKTSYTNKPNLKEKVDSKNNIVELDSNITIEDIFKETPQQQIASIKKAMEEYRNGDVVSAEEMETIFKSFAYD
ncbi:MAG: hypothetical protein FWE18_01690 [Alphaproteobacteria bacterium]|nr:hypothetical protein [Alphaproteobacteria bacterium]